jgi:hypothetical protein
MREPHRTESAFAPRGVGATLVRITLSSTDGDGTVYSTSTWAAFQGMSESATIRRWKRENPALAAHYHSHEVVTPKRHVKSHHAKEPRVARPHRCTVERRSAA